jgi:hypothetical protein
LIREGKYTFDISQIDVEINPFHAEMTFRKEISGVIVQGTIDALTPKCPLDWKTTAVYDSSTYHCSWQWRFYLMLCQMDRFDYHVFPIRESTKTDNLIHVLDHHLQSEYRYEGMDKECAELVERYVESGL